MKHIIIALSILSFPCSGFCYDHLEQTYQDYVTETSNVEYTKEQLQQFCYNILVDERLKALEKKVEYLEAELNSLENIIFDDWVKALNEKIDTSH